jgi:hypothetical protein
MSESQESSKRVKLSGGLDRTASWVYIDADDSLVIEFYDFSADAEDHFGGDIAFLIHVAPEDKQRIWAELEGAASAAIPSDHALLQRMGSRFEDYFCVQAWLDAEGLPYRKSVDHQA